MYRTECAGFRPLAGRGWSTTPSFILDLGGSRYDGAETGRKDYRDPARTGPWTDAGGVGDRHDDPVTELTSVGRPRISALDTLRGFALCGILVVNVQPIANAGRTVLHASMSGADWPGILADQRFFPIFSFLFGVGFSLLYDSAAHRVTRPRTVLLRRLLVLLAIGLAHHMLLWQGDILAVYAAVGLVVLLPSTWLPRWALPGVAAVLIAASLLWGHGFFTLIPGLFLLGSSLTRYGIIERIDRSTVVPALVGLLLAAATVPLLLLQIRTGDDRAFATAGMLTAGVYVCAVLVLLRTPARGVLRVVFTPLGRMALTNYLAATVLVRLTAPLVGGTPYSWPTATVLGLAAGILTAQWVFSTLWLRRFCQGPLEWLWRWATWTHRPPLRRAAFGG